MGVKTDFIPKLLRADFFPADWLQSFLYELPLISLGFSVL
jgi:hypothetical protein